MIKNENEQSEKTFKTIKRVDKLPLDIRIKLVSKGIFDGLIVFSGTVNSPRDITKEEQSLKLPSQLLDESYK